MLDLDTRILAQLAGPLVRCASLARFDFKSGEKRLWPGFGDLVVNGETWQGLGNLGQISQVSAGPGQTIEELVLTLFGDDTIISHFTSDAEEAVGRAVRAYFQFFEVRQTDEAGNWVDWAPIGGDPLQFFWGRMGPLFVDRPVQTGGGRATRAISTRAANAFINRRKPPFGLYSDRDQRGRTNNTDNLFVHASSMASATVNWPVF